MRWDVARGLDQAHGLPRASVFDTLYRTAAWRDLERGIGDAAEWAESAHRELEARAGRPLPRLHDEWRGAQRPIARNLELARALRRSHRVSVLSNADLSLRGRLERDLELGDLFDDVVVSAEVGMAKPEPEIFRMAARRLGVPVEACVFVDDLDLNVDAARKVGMSGVHFRLDKGDDLAAQLAALGVRPGG
jgi:putative hydrolase of the HAD superfamily